MKGYLCGHYEHKREACSRKAEKPGQSGEAKDLAGDACMNNATGEDIETSKLEEEGLRGPWMVVTPRRKPKINHTEGGW